MIRMLDSRAFGLMATLVFGLCVTHNALAGVVDFEDLSYDGGARFWNGSDGKGGFVSGGVTFENSYSYDEVYDYESWSGWSYSNISDAVTPGFGNQYSAFTGKDHTTDPGVNYAVHYEHRSADGRLLPSVTLAPGNHVLGAWFTNTTYAALSMLNGDGFAKKFGGDSGNDADWLLLSISGTDSLGNKNTVDFFLADYRFTDNSRDYVVDEWTWVDLSPLGDATELAFDLSSSDTDPIWGMNTPAFFALDDMTVVPEPGTMVSVGLGMLLGAAFLWRRNRPARAN